MSKTATAENKAFGITKVEALQDYYMAQLSRQASLLGRKEVFMGKAKFGIFGDGKEVAQLAMAKVFKLGDFRSGYYRDQTFMLAAEMLTVQQYFAQLYAHTSLEAEPASGGRLMNGHFATRLLDGEGRFRNLTQLKNSSADISPTGSQMPRLLGLAWASKLYRENKTLAQLPGSENFSVNGNEIAFGTIGNASTSEGMFFEAINAAGVLQVPMIISVWDDEFGISVPKEYHTTKGNISTILAGFQRTETEKGFEIITVMGWDYPALVAAYKKAEAIARLEHVPVLVHVRELTQPQGHSTSGSHERYKTKERLDWELSFDCNLKFREWLLTNELCTESELNQQDVLAAEAAKIGRSEAWKAFTASIKVPVDSALMALSTTKDLLMNNTIDSIIEKLKAEINPIKADSVKAIRAALRKLAAEPKRTTAPLNAWLKINNLIFAKEFNSNQQSESTEGASNILSTKAIYGAASQMVDGREVIKACFESAFARDERIIAFGEDVGKIGDVNQGFAGLQETFGTIRISDTGIRECTIVGQGIGTALRGLKPIAEIQYLDYLLYAIQILSDDVACLQYRTAGGQKAPLIIRTRGHRLEGVWHAGSPIGMILNSIRGMYLVVPRNFTQAAAAYNALLATDEPAIVIECLNGYRLKEMMPDNIADIKLELGKVEILQEGSDVTVVTYGSMCRIVSDAAVLLATAGISVEVIDVQCLLPFDVNHDILKSLQKTNRVVFADEDVPGGATAYLMQQVLENQNGYRYLDSKPITVTAKAHRPAYSSDGDYFSKPSVDDVYDAVYGLLSEFNHLAYPPYLA